MKVYTQNNITYKVGTNADENWSLILKAKPDEYWVHLEHIPSSHVIIEIDEILEEDLQYAGMLCKQQSKQSNLIACIASKIGNLKLGSKPGEVYFKNPNNIIQFTC